MTIDPKVLLVFFDSSNYLHVCEFSADDEFSSFYKFLESIFGFISRFVSESNVFFIWDETDTVCKSYLLLSYFDRPFLIYLLKSMLFRSSRRGCVLIC